MNDDDVVRDLERLLLTPSDAVARSHLIAGRPIYLSEQHTPAGYVIKQFPDGRRQLVRFDRDGEHVSHQAA